MHPTSPAQNPSYNSHATAQGIVNKEASFVYRDVTLRTIKMAVS